MEQVRKQGNGAANRQHVAQTKFTSRSRENAFSKEIDESPAMVTQRKRLDRLFGGAIQRIEDEEPLQGKFAVAQAKHELGEEEFLPGRFGTAQRASAVPPMYVGSVANQEKTIQRYTYGAGRQTRTVTVTGNNGSNQFEECTYNSVEFNQGDALPSTGTGTQAAAWSGWLKNKGKTRNATQLHVVNRLWGGLGGPWDGNIVPGSPAENTHHLHDAENVFKGCFDSSRKAKNNCKYECSANPKYGNSVNVKNGDVDYDDPDMSVTITDNGVAKTYPVTDGSGLTFRDDS